MNFLDMTADARADLDGRDGIEPAVVLIVIRQLADLRMRDGDLWRRRFSPWRGLLASERGAQQRCDTRDAQSGAVVHEVTSSFAAAHASAGARGRFIGYGTASLRVGTSRIVASSA